MGMLKEFKEFAVKGNLVDIAVAFVMGAAFGRIVTALTEGIVTPLVGLLLGGFDLSDKAYIIKPGIAEVKDGTGAIVQPAVAEVAVKWGAFVTAVIDFIIVAFVMFLIVKGINRLKRQKEAAAETPAAPQYTTSEKLLMEIRDRLGTQRM
ncbi:large conductance mechanosensitive channel protein MscL [Paraflavisolibacter sp. H34]|uniref:large conductance mechanosensitive channel protein MscL n=1 Tax=Huijunlia imazamoxiresistens TaxID=3127457 RepID=UPI003018D615